MTTVQALSSSWSLFLVRGIVAIVLAAVAFTRPSIALEAIVIIIATYAFITGALAFLAAAMSGSPGDRSWPLFLEGIIGMIIGVFIWTYRGYSAAVMLSLIAAWAVLAGVAQIAAGIQLRDVIDNEWMYVAVGIISIAFGIWLARSPMQGTYAISWLIGVYALLFGIAQIAFSLRLRSLPSRT